MKYRILGKTGFKVSEISLGTWQLGGRWGEKFNFDSAREILREAVEKGVDQLKAVDEIYQKCIKEHVHDLW